MRENLVNIHESNFGVLFYESPQPMVICDVDNFSILEVNRSAVNFYLYSKQEFETLTIRSLRAPEDLNRFDQIIPRIRGGDTLFIEAQHVIKTGEVRFVEIVSYIINYAGKMCRLAHIHDITAKAKQAQNLEILLDVGKSISENLELQTILQKVTDATTKLSGAEFGAFFYNTLDDEGGELLLYTLSGAPKEAFEKFGMPRATAVFYSTLVARETVRVDDVTQDPRYGKNMPYYGIPKGHLPVVSFLAVPVISKSGEVIGALFFGHSGKGVFTEETEKLVTGVALQAAIALDNAKLFEEVKKANLENERLLLQSQNQNFKKDEFLSIASHELKTPVTSMKGYIQILEKQSKKDHNRFYINFISKADRQLDKITALVNDLLDTSKIEAGKIHYNFSAFKVADILEDCISTIANVNKVHTIRVFGDVDLQIYADRERIEQVIANLLSNAIKYSPQASEVLIGVSSTDKFFKLEVRDFGPGIAEDKLTSVFDRFYRGEENSYTTSGLGLGLYISAEIIKRHEGKIGVESEVGKGSNFWFSLPEI